jgi:hypothetical protein
VIEIDFDTEPLRHLRERTLTESPVGEGVTPWEVGYHIARQLRKNLNLNGDRTPSIGAFFALSTDRRRIYLTSKSRNAIPN